MAVFPTGAIHRPVHNYVWDVPTLAWVVETQPGGGSGGAVTIADGADVAQGAKADAAWVSGDGTVISLLKKIASAGGSAVSVADGSDVAEGATTDAAVVTDTTGTLSGKMRGLVKWAFERMPASLGQKLMAASFPVTIASNQATFPISIRDINVGTDLNIDATGAARVRVFNSTGDDIFAGLDGGSSVGLFRSIPQLVSDGTLFHNQKSDTDGTTQFDLMKVGGAALTEGQKAMAASVPVVLASDQTAVPADVSDRDARLLGRVKNLDSAGAVIDPALKGQLPAALVGGRLDENVGAWLGSTAPTVGQKTMAASLPVTMASDQSAVPVNVGNTVAITSLVPLAVIQQDGIGRVISIKSADSLPSTSNDTALVVSQRDPLPAGTNVLGHVVVDSGPASAVAMDGVTSAFSTDWQERRLLEQSLLMQQCDALANIMSKESYISHRMGFEVR